MFIIYAEPVSQISYDIPTMTTHPAIKLQARTVALFRTYEPDSFETSAVPALDLGFEGISGDRHGGMTRRSGGREPWYPRGTEMRNERQLSIVCTVELQAIAAALAIPHLKPEWIGANLVLDGIPEFTLLPPRTCLFFAGGVTLRIDGLNVPCRSAGRGIARHYPERRNLDLDFVKAARRLRGLVAWVEKPGQIEVGETLEVRIPEQWIYGLKAST
jgi:hypothetical protein